MVNKCAVSNRLSFLFRCTRYDSCPMADMSTRWLPYNSDQCVDISSVTPYYSLPITVTEQQVSNYGVGNHITN